MPIQQYSEDGDKEFMFDDDELSVIGADNELNHPIDEFDAVHLEHNCREQITAYFSLMM